MASLKKQEDSGTASLYWIRTDRTNTCSRLEACTIRAGSSKAELQEGSRSVAFTALTGDALRCQTALGEET